MRLERWILIIPLRLRSLFRREDVDRELDEELAFTWIHALRNSSPVASIPRRRAGSPTLRWKA